MTRDALRLLSLDTLIRSKQVNNAVFISCNLFRTIAISVGEHFGFVYNKDDDDNMLDYLNRVKGL